jgi:hypothetical protein
VAYKIQQLKLTGILDQAVAVVKDNFGLLFTIVAICWIPLQLLTGIISVTMMPQFSGRPTPEEMRAVDPAQVMMASMVILGLVAIQMLIALPLMNAAVIYAVAEKYLGRDVTAGEALRKGLTKILPLIGTGILMYLAVMGGFILLIIPGILFALWFGLAQHTVVLENLSGVKALSRSKELVRPNMGTFLMLGMMVGVISWLLGAGSQMIPQKHVAMLVNVLVTSAVTLFSTAAFVVFYFSCRCAVENFDLEHLAASIDSGEEPSERIAGAEA